MCDETSRRSSLFAPSTTWSTTTSTPSLLRSAPRRPTRTTTFGSSAFRATGSKRWLEARIGEGRLVRRDPVRALRGVEVRHDARALQGELHPLVVGEREARPRGVAPPARGA